jgi:hypothetical protein
MLISNEVCDADGLMKKENIEVVIHSLQLKILPAHKINNSSYLHPHNYTAATGHCHGFVHYLVLICYRYL